ALLSVLMIMFALGSASFLDEKTSESFIFLAPLALSFTVFGFYYLHREKRGSAAVLGLGLTGIGILYLSLWLSFWYPMPLFTNTFYAIVTTTMLACNAFWIWGVNWLGITHRILPKLLCLIGFIAGFNWLILLISSVSLWQPFFPHWLLGINISIWIPAYFTWIIWLAILLFTTGRDATKSHPYVASIES
ncbi:MAG: hypothetical protein KDE51_12520, partial [Anaerolineales bacterium]|nr:hypothetical protein [Anaerolineales bacterium]